MGDAAFIRDYFVAEKHTALLWMLVGAAAIVLAAWLLRRRSAWRGMAGPLVAVALIQLAVGATVYLRSDAQSAQRQQSHREDAARFKAVEATRIRTVIADLERYKAIEISVLALGMAVVVLLRNRPFWLAFGFGLVLQAGLMLALDFIAAARAQTYFKAVIGT